MSTISRYFGTWNSENPDTIDDVLHVADFDKDQNGKLSREELLNAIDFEMKRRESLLSRHGISTWGLIVAIAALLWTATVEALGQLHNWTNVLLVFTAGGSFLSLISSPWLRAFGIGVHEDRDNNSRTLNALLFRAGLVTEAIPIHLISLVLNLAISVYLGFQGFPLLAITTGILYTFLFCLLCFCWFLTCIKVPIKLKPTHTGLGARPKILSWLLVITIAIVPIDALASVWPADKGDIRLGLILAALASVAGTSLYFSQQSPIIARLQSLRSRVGLGRIEIGTAKSELESILYGPPEEYYLTQKAASVETAMRDYAKLWTIQIEHAQRMISLAEQLRSSPTDQILLQNVTIEFRSSFKKHSRRLSEIDKHLAAVVKLQSEFLIRIETAKSMLELKPELVKQITDRTDTLWKDIRQLHQKFESMKVQFISDSDFIFKSQQNVKVPQRLKWRDVYKAFFCD